MLNNQKKILLLLLKNGSSDPNPIYDYSSSPTIAIKGHIEESTYVIRTKDDLFKNIEQHADIKDKEGDVLIFYVNNTRKNTFFLMNPIPKKLKLNEKNLDYLNNKMWYVLRSVDLENYKQDNSNNNDDYHLNENDIIRIGKIKYVVQKIYLIQKENNLNSSEPPTPILEDSYNISDLNKGLGPVFDVYEVNNYSGYADIDDKEKKQDKIKMICKFCPKDNINEDTDDGEDFLISVCKCKELVHYKCLKNYFKSLLEKKKNNENEIYDDVMTFINFQCDDCKEQYPTKFKLTKVDKIFDLIEIETPIDCNYMILESLDYKQNESYIKSIHIIKFIKKNGEPFKIGRDNDNDIQDTDISISRHHAIIRFNDIDGKIIIQNWNSKYGTLILVRKPINILDKKIYLQVGKTYIEGSLMNYEEYEKIKNEKK